MSKARYIMKNRALGTMSHGQQRHEYVTYDIAGRELDRIECTPSTASWLWTGCGVEGISPARMMEIDAERERLVAMFDKVESYVLIINAVHEPQTMRQLLALEEMDRRGLWLSDDQKAQAGLVAA